MKTILKAVLACAVAVMFGFFVSRSFTAYISEDTENSKTDRYTDMMVESREFFAEKSESAQLFTALLLDMPALQLYQNDEEPIVYYPDGTVTPAAEVFDETALSYIADLFGDTEQENVRLLSIDNAENSVKFYTYRDKHGFIGFLYMKDETLRAEYTDLLELIEEWQLFYRLD